MLLYALNIRQSQVSADGNSVRVPRTNLYNALKNLDQYVMLFTPRDEDDPGYKGLVRIAGIEPDVSNSSFFWIEFGDRRPFDAPVTLKEIYRGDTALPFHTYARAIRVIPQFHLDRIAQLAPNITVQQAGFAATNQVPFSFHEIPRRTKSSRLFRNQAIRMEMLRQYGSACLFSHQAIASLDGRRFAVQVGHIWPLQFGGPDDSLNVLPMSGIVNWLWDEGMISLKNSGDVLMAQGLGGEVRYLLRNCSRIRFPMNTKFWPKAEYIEWHRTHIFESSKSERDRLRISV